MTTTARIARPLLIALWLACSACAGAATADGPTTVTVPADGPLAALAHGLRPTQLKAGETLPGWSLQQRMAHYKVPGVAIAVLKDGVVVQAAGFGVREAGTRDRVDADTAFSVGSVSKVLSAAVTLRLAANGTLDIDRDVAAYLESWRIPDAAGIDNAPITLRMLMSHTAGLSVHGFEDYLPGEPLPTLLQTLDGHAPAKNDAVVRLHAPGARMRYSGGGVTVEQLAIESVTGEPLEAVARAQVFAPLGMRRSTFANPLPATFGNIAKAHDDSGAPVARPRGWESFPELAASGLWTSAHDMGAFVGALIQSHRGRGDFLPRAIATQMMTEVEPSLHGLGPRLDGAGATRLFHHGGANDSYRAWIEGHLQSGDGMVILTNGTNGGELMMEIRNAINDALDPALNPPLRTIDVDLSSADFAAYAGTWALDPSVPADLQGNLAGYFETGSVALRIVDGRLGMVRKTGSDTPLAALTSARFVLPGDQDQPVFQFHRDVRGNVAFMTVERASARLYFRRAP